MLRACLTVDDDNNDTTTTTTTSINAVAATALTAIVDDEAKLLPSTQMENHNQGNSGSLMCSLCGNEQSKVSYSVPN